MLHERHLIVLAVIAGRKFSHRPKYTVAAEAKFDKEVLTVDPVQHNEQPCFEQELAWELDKQSLRQHRLQRSSINLQLFAIGDGSYVKEPIGYIILDVRSACDRKVFKWYKILNSKYKGNPEIYCGLYLENDGQDVVFPSENGRTIMQLDRLQLTPKRCLEKLGGDQSVEVFRIGPPSLAQEDFVFTTNLLCVSNVINLIVADTTPPAGTGSYKCKVVISILGIEVCSSSFDNLINNRFSTDDSWTFNIRSAVDLLRAYFCQSNVVKVMLYCDSKVLAERETSLTELFQQIDHAFLTPACREGTFSLFPMNTEMQDRGDDSEARFAEVLLRFSFQRKSVKGEVTALPLAICAGRGDLSIITQTNNSALSPTEDSPEDKDNCGSPAPFNLDAAVLHLENKSYNNNKMLESNLEIPAETKVQYVTNNDELEATHRYCYTIELKTIKAYESLEAPVHVYARYTYPSFGSTSPVMTLPPVRLSHINEKLLPQGYCTFELASTLPELQSRLQKFPLVVEVMSRSPDDGGKETVFGRTNIKLDDVFSQPWEEIGHCRRTRLDAIACVKAGKRAMVKLSYSLVLEDFGPYVPSEIDDDTVATSALGDIETIPASPPVSLRRMAIGPTTSSCLRNRTHSSPCLVNDKSLATADRDRHQTPENGAGEVVRQTPEYRAALELELWKAEEESRFKDNLRTREQKLITVFTEEWQKRENERELICRKKLSEYQALEHKLCTVLDSLGIRERELTVGEAELVRLRSEMMQELDLRRREMTATIQRDVKDARHDLELERRRSESLQQQLEEWQTKYAELERIMQKKQSAKSTEAIKSVDSDFITPPTSTQSEEISRLHFEIVRLTTELTASRDQLNVTERRLDHSQRGRMRYKDLWTRALREVARLRADAEEKTRNALQRREAEVEGLRERCLIRNNHESLLQATPAVYCPPPVSLTQIRNELQRQQNIVFNDAPPIESNSMSKVDPSKSHLRLEDKSQLARLIEERDSLLNSGVYEEDDPIIIELNHEISRILEPPGLSSQQAAAAVTT